MTTIYIDFSRDTVGSGIAPWDNNVTDYASLSSSPLQLIDSNDSPTDYYLDMVSGGNSTGALSSNVDILNSTGYPDKVARSYFLGDASSPQLIRVSGLTPNQAFTLSLTSFSYSNTRHTDVSVNGGASQRYLNSRSVINAPISFSGVANSSGNIDISLSPVELYSQINALTIEITETENVLTVDNTDVTFGATLNITSNVTGITAASIEDSYGNTLQLNVLSDTQLSLPVIVHGLNAIIFENDCALSISNGTDSASTSVNLLPPSGYNLTTLTEIVFRDLIESDWIYNLNNVKVNDQSITLASDSFVTHNSDGSSEVSGAGTYTFYTIDSSSGVVTQVTKNIQDQEVDTEKPVITLLGNASVTITERDTYTDDGATAIDDTDGDITASIVTVNPVDVNTPATYTITYNVSDAAGNAADEVTRTVIVEDEVVNQPPVANAGPNQSVAAGATVTLDGTGSTDGDGTIVTWSWEEITNSGVVLQNADAETVSFVAPELSYSQNIRLQLTVTDNDGLSDNDSVTVTVAAKQTGGGGSASVSSYRHGVYVTEVPTRRKFN